ncbi:phosphatidylglycerophosphatase A family protein [Alcaligenes faecalis]|jgi:phosphatidylglycerophosphatase A|uniref:Phosphatidylglycerophosphatase A n=2 Tax=Alcaligenes TaxID=507 RepID=A0A0M9IEK8_ALCFA|nr:MULTISPECIES: phosphatidylglycerophosphatase A [Alcaligenes]MBX6964668.1 phosphatidylglycerophosphatase A [Providencia rettgeri]ALO39434.1 phosphatidylglycerophosphatase [Alcaligenes faecalis]ARP54779.1 phosphatidylglycerophosphatase [Alcaligenes faecalis]ATI00685.1 phosphatidylglycerophosphatase A [Alcaligenes faecalis]AYZ90039.1 phosphatidylglycerophosphatase A [Alcaligenes faecalis]
MSTFPDPSLNPIQRPTLDWVVKKPWRLIAFGGGTGVLRPGPGTWGTVLAWVLWVLGLHVLTDTQMAIFLPVTFFIGCWACHRTGYDLGVSDHSGMNWDEMVAFWLVLWLIPQTWLAQGIAFVLFRFFDILKPPPIRYFDRRLHNGFGVMWDDLLAAGYTLLLMAVLVRFGVFS